MNSIQIPSSFSNNAIILISSPRKNELNVGRRLHEDLTTLRAEVQDFHLEHHYVSTRHDLIEILRDIARKSKKGLRPIIHFDMHGDQRRGLEINPSREFASWLELTAWLRKINIRARNNLCVIAAACHGLHMISPISIHNAVPFYCLIAPEQEVTLGFINDRMYPFYKKLLQSGNLHDALHEIKGTFKEFHCEKMLTIVLAKYIKFQCKGAGFRKRKEQLITDALSRDIPRTQATLRHLRKLVKENINPSELLIKKYASRFLIGKEYQVTLDQIAGLIEGSYTRPSA